MNIRLAAVDFLAGQYGIADIANWSWAKIHRWAHVAIDALNVNEHEHWFVGACLNRSEFGQYRF